MNQMPGRFEWSRRSIAAACMLAFTVAVANAGRGPRDFLKKSPDWFASPDAKQVAANILSFQSDYGGWPKNIDTTACLYGGKRADLAPTFDNSATTDELRFLARIYNATKDEQFRKAFDRGVDYILKAQYPSGGWPQHYPAGDKYHKYITFNDSAMVRLMEFLREYYTLKTYDFADAERRLAARRAFDRGVECILKCQIVVNGKRTAWCAQHDEKTFEPRPARTYELVSTSGSESVGIARLLCSLDKPNPEVIRAIEAAAAWFEAAKITGIRVVDRNAGQSGQRKDKQVVEDATAPPIWARFYAIGTNRPIFSDRDGVIKHSLMDIGPERRNGYSWLGYWPQSFLEKDYPAWRKKWVSASSTP